MAALSCQSNATAVKQITSRHLTTPRTAVSTEIAGYQYFISHLSLLDPHNSSYGYGHAVTEEGGGKPAQKCPLSHIHGDSCMHSHTQRQCRAWYRTWCLCKVWASGVPRGVWLMSNSAVGTAHPTWLTVKLERGASLSVGIRVCIFSSSLQSAQQRGVGRVQALAGIYNRCWFSVSSCCD